MLVSGGAMPIHLRYRPCLEILESRIAPANLVLTNALLVNAHDFAMPSPDIGEMVFVEADWTTNNLPSNASYHISYAVDGVTLNTSSLTYGAGSSGTQSWYWYIGGWFATSGSHSVTVTVNPDHSVTESTYADNALS